MFKNKEGKVRSGWKIAGVLFVVVIAIMIVGILIGIIWGAAAGIYYKSFQGDNVDIQKITNSVKNNSIFNAVMMLSQEIVTIIIPIIAWKLLSKRPLSNMGLTPIKKNYKDLIIGLFFGIVSMSAVFLLIVATGNAKVDSWTPHFNLDQLTYLFIFIFVGFAEEILTRGYIMSVLRQMRNVPVAVIISSVIFALMHSGNSGIGIIPYINLALVGILFAYMYVRSGNIWMCIGYHITWNYFQGNVFGFLVSGNDTTGIWTTQYDKNNYLNGGSFGPEGGLFVTIVILLGLLFVKYYYRNSEFDFVASEPTVNTAPVIQDQTAPLQNTDQETDTADIK